ncbi:MAG: 1-acyl-sn-glycerol-3-phosphate acyltransferase [Candidatus Omnitrophica bacterium]|nr:1-acyl-sn-glycerol-3-phosphate acyltransferase [Candidatus Omnitrophota bacterium]
MPRANPLIYGVVRTTSLAFYRLFFKFRSYGAEKVPGPAEPLGVILAPNHVSYLDPPVLGISLRRKVTYLAKEYLFSYPLLGFILRGVGVLPVKTKTDDFRSLRDLIRWLKGGGCVVVFPEGTRSPDGELKEPESGAGFLAVKSRSLVVPVYIHGTRQALPRDARWFKPYPVSVYYGEPFLPADDRALMSEPDPYLAVSRRIMAEIAKIRNAVEHQSTRAPEHRN